MYVEYLYLYRYIHHTVHALYTLSVHHTHACTPSGESMSARVHTCVDARHLHIHSVSRYRYTCVCSRQPGKHPGPLPDRYVSTYLHSIATAKNIGRTTSTRRLAYLHDMLRACVRAYASYRATRRDGGKGLHLHIHPSIHPSVRPSMYVRDCFFFCTSLHASWMTGGLT